MNNFDEDLINSVRERPRSLPDLSRELGEDTDRLRGALERLRDAGRVSRTQRGKWVDSTSCVTRGRPKSARTIELDLMIHELVRKEPRTTVQLSKLVGVSTSRVYLSLDRLRKAGRVDISSPRRGQVWVDTTPE